MMRKMGGGLGKGRRGDGEGLKQILVYVARLGWVDGKKRKEGKERIIYYNLTFRVTEVEETAS